MITLQEEKLEDILDELKPLLESHWEEVAWYKEQIELNPDYDRYLCLERAGCLHIVTARDDGELIGYDVSFIMPNMHYSDHTYACNDIIFLLPSYRHGQLAYDMVKHKESLLREKGVSVATYHMKLAHPFTRLMEATGFETQEYVYSKYIGD